MTTARVTNSSYLLYEAEATLPSQSGSCLHSFSVTTGSYRCLFFFFFQAEDGIRDLIVTGVQTCALPIFPSPAARGRDDEGLVRQRCHARGQPQRGMEAGVAGAGALVLEAGGGRRQQGGQDRKSGV